MKTSAPRQRLVRRAGEALRVRLLREQLLDRPELLAAAIDRAVAVAADDVPHAEAEQHVGHGHAGRADAGRHDLHVRGALVDELQCVEERGRRDDRGAVLVVVEDRDVEPLLKPALDLEAARGGDVLEVDAAEAGRDGGDRGDDLVHVGRGEADRPGVDTAELLEQHRLALHHRHRRLGADVAEPEHRGAVADDRDRVLLDREVPDLADVLGDRGADPRDAGRVSHREVVAGPERHLRGHLDLAAEMQQERPVGDVLDLDARQRVHGGDDLLDVVGARGVDRDVADLLALLDPHEIDRAQVAARVADRARHVGERTRAVVQMHPQGRAEGG